MTSSPPARATVILGSTGSIGRKAVAVAARYPERIRVAALATGRDVKGLAEQARRLRVPHVVVADPAGVEELRSLVPPETRVDCGMDPITALARSSDVELVVNGIVGRAGLDSSLAAAETGKTLAIANKESLVLAGALLMRTAAASGARVIPVDSEHSGLFQILEGRDPAQVSRLIITASGGPFRGRTAAELQGVTPEQALQHPIWPMGRRITVDSATLFNKGLEVIETHHLFGVPLERIAVWVHPQSVVHAVVEMVDGSLIAQLSAPDMMMPVQLAMSHPDRWPCDAPPCALPDWRELRFEEPDHQTFPALGLAYRAARMGGTAPAALNAADEVAVEAFLEERIRFPEIVEILNQVLDRAVLRPGDSLPEVAAADREARELARSLVEARVP